MKNLQEYEDYFKQIVENYEPLKQFYHIDLFKFREFEQDLRSKKFKTPLLLLETYDKDISDNGKFNINQTLKGAFVIIDNFDIRIIRDSEKTEFLTNLENIAKQVVNKMIIDKQTSCNALNGLVIKSFSISITELIATSFKGFRIEFSIKNIYKPTLDDNWL